MNQSPQVGGSDDGNWLEVRAELETRFGGQFGSPTAIEALAAANSLAAQNFMAQGPSVSGQGQVRPSAAGLATCLYRIVVRTGTRSGAGTDSNVYLTMYGPEQVSREILLYNSHDAFEYGNEDRFSVETADVGELKAIRVRHDNTGFRPGWLLDHVLIIRETPPIQEWLFLCKRWLAVDEDDGEISRLLFPSSSNIPTVA